MVMMKVDASILKTVGGRIRLVRCCLLTSATAAATVTFKW